jgi:hypothetical protein
MIADRVNRITRLRTAHHPPVRRVASRPITDHIRLANKSCPHGDEEAAKRRKTPEVTGASASAVTASAATKKKEDENFGIPSRARCYQVGIQSLFGGKTIGNSYNIKNNKQLK